MVIIALIRGINYSTSAPADSFRPAVVKVDRSLSVECEQVVGVPEHF
jgi:hypothetical protein